MPRQVFDSPSTSTHSSWPRQPPAQHHSSRSSGQTRDSLSSGRIGQVKTLGGVTSTHQALPRPSTLSTQYQSTFSADHQAPTTRAPNFPGSTTLTNDAQSISAGAPQTRKQTKTPSIIGLPQLLLPNHPRSFGQSQDLTDIPSRSFSNEHSGLRKPPPLRIQHSTHNPLSKKRDMTKFPSSDLNDKKSTRDEPPKVSEGQKSSDTGTLRAMRQIFYFCSARDYLLYVLPAVFCSILCGLLPPYMTIMIGDAFQAFTDYTVSTADANLNSLDDAKSLLRHRIGVVALKLVIIGIVTLVLSLATHTLWAINGSKISQKIQIAVYDAVSERELGWFETGMKTQYVFRGEENSTEAHDGTDEDIDDVNSRTNQSPAGLMGRFSRQTEDIRAAISGRLGLIIQYSVTLIANIILAFTKSYKLSLVILCTIPVLAFLTGLSGKMTAPLLVEQALVESTLSSEIGRLVKNISIAKAFNAQPLEVVKLVRLSKEISQIYLSLVKIWALRLGICQCLSLVMFVQGFGFGSRLIQSGEVTAGDVNTVFWSCLVASSYLQMLIPLLSYLEKAEAAIFNLIALTVYESDLTTREALRQSVKVDRSQFKQNNSLPKLPDSPPILVPLPEIHTRKSLRRNLTVYSKARTSATLSSATSTAYSSSGYYDSDHIPHVPEISSTSEASPYKRLNSSESPMMTPGGMHLIRVGKSRVRKLRKLIPQEFKGQLELKDVTFHYPSNQPEVVTPNDRTSLPSTKFDPEPNLDSVSIFFPAGEFTFIVGESGSGKSTVSAILLGLYPILNGSVEADELGSIDWLDGNWYRNQIGLVSGVTSNFILPGTIHENIAIGAAGSRDWRTVTRQEVTQAAKFALLHDFIRDLPDGYDTRLIDDNVLGEEPGNGAEYSSDVKRTGGVQNMSGGQKQRLGLARAWLRDPPVLILDEATSALDMTTQALMYDAIRYWRDRKTTICITHDLKPIRPTDYVYVMQGGKVIENDFRYNLEAKSPQASVFKQMAKKTERRSTLALSKFSQNEQTSQLGTRSGVFSGPSTKEDSPSPTRWSDEVRRPAPSSQFTSKKAKRVTFVDGFLHAMQVESTSLGPQSSGIPQRFTPGQNIWGRYSISKTKGSDLGHASDEFAMSSQEELRGEANSLHSSKAQSQLSKKTNIAGRRSFNLLSDKISRRTFQGYNADDDHDFQKFSAAVMLQASKFAADRRVQQETHRELGRSNELLIPKRRRKWSQVELDQALEQEDKSSPSPTKETDKSHHRIDIGLNQSSGTTWGMKELVKKIMPTVPQKWWMVLGFFLSISSGAMTPVFSVLLGNLLSKIANPPSGYIAKTSGLIIFVAIVDGILACCRILVMEKTGTTWLESMRRVGFEKLVLQDQPWFDQSENSPSNLINRFIKDGVDCKELIGQIFADIITILTLITMAFLWALLLGWQLTLVGLSLAPLFFFIIGGGGKVASRYEHINKLWREQVANQFHQTISNVKAIRLMTIESLLRERFINSTKQSRKMFIRAAPFGGMSYGLNITLTYLAEALMFYVGSILVIKGTYTFTRLSQVFSLIIFSVTFAGQMISAVPSYSKAVRATMDFHRLVSLPMGTNDTKGDLRVPLQGKIEFRQVNFSYPSRPNVKVLHSVSFVIHPGECVGIVGASGSGKSTVAALLHRLYNPDSGSIRLDDFNISQIDSRHVREHIGIVTQHPVLFNATVLENVSYGHVPIQRAKGEGSGKMSQILLRMEVDRVLNQAHLGRFVKELPSGVDTKIGENSDLISTGQAQRLSIARTLLLKERKVLVFDESTSALDLINQAGILKTIDEVKRGKTSIIITHKAAVMKTCDRLIVMDHGRVVEQGTYRELINKPNGVLCTMSKSGEWNASD